MRRWQGLASALPAIDSFESFAALRQKYGSPEAGVTLRDRFKARPAEQAGRDRRVGDGLDEVLGRPRAERSEGLEHAVPQILMTLGRVPTRRWNL